MERERISNQSTKAASFKYIHEVEVGSKRARHAKSSAGKSDKRGVARMWRTVGEIYRLYGRGSGSFGLLCDLERVLHGETPLEWNLVGRYRELMAGLAAGVCPENLPRGESHDQG